MDDTGLIRYDRMCHAIAECYSVDEVKEIRSKARAIEVYAKQAMNLEAERQAAQVRIRAEERTGALLKEMKRDGRRQAGGRPKKRYSDGTVSLSEIGISKKQSSQWQQLAEMPKVDFEQALAKSGVPTTEGVLSSMKEEQLSQVSEDALQAWGRIKDFERHGLLDLRLSDLVDQMTDPMREDVHRLVPMIRVWLDIGAKSSEHNQRRKTGKKKKQSATTHTDS